MESQEPESIFTFYRRLIDLRRNQNGLRNGSYQTLDPDNPNVLAYLRKNPGVGASVLVVLNMSAQPQMVSYDLSGYGIKLKVAKPLLTAPEITGKTVDLSSLTIAPFGVFIGAVH